MQVRTQIALNIAGQFVPSGEVIDIPEEDAWMYIRLSHALPVDDIKPVETRKTKTAAAKRTADADK